MLSNTSCTGCAWRCHAAEQQELTQLQSSFTRVLAVPSHCTLQQPEGAKQHRACCCSMSMLHHASDASVMECADLQRCCRPFTNAMAADLIRSLGSSLTSVKQANITVNNAVQVRHPVAELFLSEPGCQVSAPSSVAKAAQAAWAVLSVSADCSPAEPA